MKKLTFVIGVLIGLNGCSGNWYSVKHEFQISGQNPSSISIDAKQRVVLASSGEEKQTSDTYVETLGPEGKPTGSTRTITTSSRRLPRVCAEPSPDAITAIAQGISGSGDLTGQKLDAALKLQGAYTSNETAAFIGLRTQSIQLLRDGMYRLCEGYMDGALSPSDFNQLHRRYQILMLGLLSIEQLTGAVVAPQIAITSGAASATQTLDAASQNHAVDSYAKSQVATEKSIKEQTDLVAQIKTEKDLLATLDAASPEHATKAAAIAKLEADKTKKDDEVTLNKKKDEAYKYAINVSMNGGSSASVSEGTAKILSASRQIQTENFKAMADTVLKIVDTTVISGFRDEACYLEHLRQFTSKEIGVAAFSCNGDQVSSKISTTDKEISTLKSQIPSLANPEPVKQRVIDLETDLKVLKKIQAIQ